jgi:hypothetical protein
MKKQTPIEWLGQQIGSKIADANIRISAPKFYELINQAKEMEDEQNKHNGGCCAVCGSTSRYNDEEE